MPVTEYVLYVAKVMNLEGSILLTMLLCISAD